MEIRLGTRKGEKKMRVEMGKKIGEQELAMAMENRKWK